jgi:hypothetical protein
MRRHLLPETVFLQHGHGVVPHGFVWAVGPDATVSSLSPATSLIISETTRRVSTSLSNFPPLTLDSLFLTALSSTMSAPLLMSSPSHVSEGDLSRRLKERRAAARYQDEQEILRPHRL